MTTDAPERLLYLLQLRTPRSRPARSTILTLRDLDRLRRPRRRRQLRERVPGLAPLLRRADDGAAVAHRPSSRRRRRSRRPRGPRPHRRRAQAEPGGARGLVQDRARGCSAPIATSSRPSPLRPSPRRCATGALRGIRPWSSAPPAEAQGIAADDAVLAFLHAALSNLVSVRCAADPARPDPEPADHQGGLAAADTRSGGGLRHGVGCARQRHRRPRYRQHAARAPAHAALHVVSFAHAVRQ